MTIEPADLHQRSGPAYRALADALNDLVIPDLVSATPQSLVSRSHVMAGGQRFPVLADDWQTDPDLAALHAAAGAPQAMLARVQAVLETFPDAKVIDFIPNK